jgi:hypothetical protein
MRRPAALEEGCVYVSLTRTQGSPDDTGLATMVGEEMLRWLRDIEGFEGLLMLSDEAQGTTIVLTFWESEDVAERRRVARMAFRDRITSTVNVRVEETVGYDVAFAHLGPRVTDTNS